MGRHKTNDIDRFWSYVKKGEPDECWIWQGGKRGSTEYGLCFFEGKRQSAHRVSYQINIGPIPEGMDVLHRCDNPPCCNPAHLFAGTHTQNMRDMAQKGRNRVPLGEDNNLSKLTEKDVREIRDLLKMGLSQRSIAKFYGVTSPVISCINTGKTWKHVRQPFYPYRTVMRKTRYLWLRK